MAFKINKPKMGVPKAKQGGNLETEALEEVNNVSKRMREEQAVFKKNTDANYFTVLTFNNSDQLDEFLSKLGLNLPDKQYIDGKQFAAKLGIEIDAPDLPPPGNFKIGKEFSENTL